jgi:hypothetical protein
MRGTHSLQTAEGGTSQDKVRKRPSEGHSPTGDRRGGASQDTKRSDQVRGTHSLETAEGGSSQNTKRKQLSKGHSQTRDRRGRDKSGHGKEVTKQGTLTFWTPQRKGQVRTRKGRNRARDTHFLETAEGGTSQGTARKLPSEGCSLPGNHRERNKSEHEKEVTARGALTFWRPQLEGQVRAWKEDDRARGTHFLETTERGTSQDTEGNRLSEGHSLPGDHRGGVKSGHRREVTERGALTNWRPQREGQVRTW